MTKINAPFKDQTMQHFEKYQNAGVFHPYTCETCKPGILKIKESCLYCPDCDYTQTWINQLPEESILDEQRNWLSQFNK